LYKETPHRLISKAVKASQVKKGRVGETAWELQASTVEELQALGEKVRRSRDRNDQKLATQVSIVYSAQICQPRCPGMWGCVDLVFQEKSVIKTKSVVHFSHFAIFFRELL
jgi:hypothetical protein